MTSWGQSHSLETVAGIHGTLFVAANTGRGVCAIKSSPNFTRESRGDRARRLPVTALNRAGLLRDRDLGLLHDLLDVEGMIPGGLRNSPAKRLTGCRLHLSVVID
eukprot:scaffold4931_cov392-Prasinococcus_capsulatus_cf.AAC.1